MHQNRHKNITVGDLNIDNILKNQFISYYEVRFLLLGANASELHNMS